MRSTLFRSDTGQRRRVCARAATAGRVGSAAQLMWHNRSDSRMPAWWSLKKKRMSARLSKENVSMEQRLSSPCMQPAKSTAKLRFRGSHILISVAIAPSVGHRYSCQAVVHGARNKWTGVWTRMIVYCTNNGISV